MARKKYKFMNRIWSLRYVNELAGECRGHCDPFDRAGKEILILKRLVGVERLEILIHEHMHAAGWCLAESFIKQFAEEMAEVLIEEGFVDSLEESNG